MIKNAKKMINTKVFAQDTGNYLGKISDIAFSKDGQVKGYYMSSDSIIPLDVWICPGAVIKSKKGKMIVGKNLGKAEENLITFNKNISKRDFTFDGRKIGQGRDMIFDSETGEIQGFLYSENIFKKPSLIEINKIKIKGKNIDVKSGKEWQ